LWRIVQCSLDVLRLNGRIAVQNLFFRGSFGEANQNHGYGNSRSCGADFPAADILIAFQEFLPGDHDFYCIGLRFANKMESERKWKAGASRLASIADYRG